MGVHCLLRAERHDGNDPTEAMITLSHRPMKKDIIEVWVKNSGFRNSPRPKIPEEVERGFSWSGEQRWLEVTQVVLHAYGDETDETLEVWVKMDGYDLAELEETMAAANRRESP